MATGINGEVGTFSETPPHFYFDYLFKETALPNSGNIESESFTLNNTLSQLQLRGVIPGSLTAAAGNNLSVKLQYQDVAADTWKDFATIFQHSGAETLAGDLFVYVIPQDTEKRDFRMVVTTNFDASAAKFSCPIEIIPKP